MKAGPDGRTFTYKQEGEVGPATRLLLEASNSFLPWGLFPSWVPSLTCHSLLSHPIVRGWKSILIKCHSKGGSGVTNLSPSAQNIFSFKTEGWGTRVHPWRIHIDVWQNQYSIVKQNLKNCFKKKKKKDIQFINSGYFWKRDWEVIVMRDFF